MTGRQPGSTVWSYPFGVPDRLRLHPRYAHLREHEPLARVQLPYGEASWMVTGYADVRTVLGDSRFSRALGRDEPRMTPDVVDAGLLSLDPPEHTRLRALVARAFTTRRMAQMRTRVQEIASDLVAAMLRAGPPADLVEQFGVPLPVIVMCELLGVPAQDRHRFGRWAGATVAATSLSPSKVREYNGRLGIYMAKLVEQRRREPTDADLLGALVQARDNEDRLSEAELLYLASALLALGFETTATQIPNFAYLLLTHPEPMRWLWAHPEGVPVAVEELMRYSPIATFAGFPRYATEDVQLEGGLVRAGEPVLVVSAAADRDPRVFADPEVLDLRRDPNPHLGFSHGVHHCLGAQLARMELQVALTTLVEAMPALRLAVDEPQIRWKQGEIVRGPAWLPITW